MRFLKPNALGVRPRSRTPSADVDNSGATLVCLSPGAASPVTVQVKVCGLVQLTLCRRVTGYQIERKHSVQVGLRCAF